MMIPRAVQDSIDRIRAADDESRASQASFALGPQAFADYWKRTSEQARKRIEEVYGQKIFDLPDDGAR